MNDKASWVLLTLLSVGMFGCSERTPSDPSTMAPANTFELDIPGRRLMSAEPAQLRASLGNISLIDFWFTTSDQAGSINVTGRLPATQTGSDSFVLSISNGPMADGIVSVQINGAADSPDMSGGTVSIDIAPNGVGGEVVLPSSQQSWKFAGKMLATCWVPSASIPGAQPNVGGTSADSALVSDAAFSSDACAPLRHWAGK